MKKNGFALIETVVVVVVLTSSLLLLYSSFNKILQTEKTRVNYDDVNYIYRTWYIKNAFNSLNMVLPMRDLDTKTNNGKGIHFVVLGVDYEGLFDGYESKKNYVTNMLNSFEAKQVILLKTNKLDNIKKCTKECSVDTNCGEYDNCNQLYTNLSEDMITYLQSLNIDLDSIYTLVVEYESCDNDNVCRSYFGWVGA